MKLTWFGTAGFKIESDKHTLLIDPYFTRNKKAFPRQALKPSDIQTADTILITHFNPGGHKTLCRTGQNISSGYCCPDTGDQ